jgi:dienelactone hydrolase
MSGGVTIPIDCYAPSKGSKLPVAVVLHGENGLGEANLDPLESIAKSLARDGYVALVPHYFARTGHVVGQEVTPEELDAFMVAVQDAVRFAGSRPDIDGERVGIFGYGGGAFVGAACATREPRIKAVVACSAAVMSEMPTLLLLGAEDESIPAQDVRRFTATMKAKKIPQAVHAYSGVGHEFFPGEFIDAGWRAGVFFDEHVKTKEVDKRDGEQRPGPRKNQNRAGKANRK